MNERPEARHTGGGGGQASTVRLSHKEVRLREAAILRIRRAMVGLAYMGISFLLGSCNVIFGAMPLGLSLLCASTTHTWYIVAGMALGVVFSRGMLPTAAWIGIIVLCVLLRLAILFFVDPPVMHGKRASGMDLRYLRFCWREFTSVFRRRVRGEESHDEVTHRDGDTYPMKPNQSGAGGEKEGAQSGGTAIPVRARLFCENLFFRMLTGSVCGFAAGLGMMIVGGFQFYDLFGALCMIVGVPLLTFLFSGCFGESGRRLLFAVDPMSSGGSIDHRDGLLSRFPLITLISATGLLLCLTYAARPFSLTFGGTGLGIYLAPLLGIILTLSTTRRLGFVPGVVAAVVCGLGAAPLLSPAIILCAVIYAPLRILSHRMGVVGGCMAALVWCVAAGSMETLWIYIPTIVLALPIYLVIEQISSRIPTISSIRGDAQSDFAIAVTHETRTDAHRARLKSMSEAFTSLSELFYSLSSQLRRPQMLDLRRMCDAAFDKQCASCRNRDICWGAEYDRTLELTSQLTGQLHTKGRADAGALEPMLREFCPYVGEIVEDINARCSQMTEALLRSEKTEVFAADYQAIGELLNDALAEDGEEYRCNREAADAIYDYLSSKGVGVQGVVVCGKRNCRVIVRGVHFDKASGMSDQIREELERICGTRLSDPTFEIAEDHTVMLLSSEATLHTAFSGSTVPAGALEGEILPPPLEHTTAEGEYTPPSNCGDHIAIFKSEQAYFYALISDGMGSGSNASFTSDICAVFLEKMLSAGNRVEISLRMLNSFIRSKNSGTGDECSATIDLMELDLLNGNAVFVKNGAPPTYVVRGNTVYKLRSRTFPIGILKDSDIQLLQFRTHPGDVVVMVSDGVTHGNDECPWLIDMLSDPLPESMDSLRTDILRRAIASGSPDDLSAIAIRIEDARGNE